MPKHLITALNPYGLTQKPGYRITKRGYVKDYKRKVVPEHNINRQVCINGHLTRSEGVNENLAKVPGVQGARGENTWHQAFREGCKFPFADTQIPSTSPGMIACIPSHPHDLRADANDFTPVQG